MSMSAKRNATPPPPTGMFMQAEIASQPLVWAQAAALSSERAAMPPAGHRVAVVGCGTSWFMAQAYASLRESFGHGITDAFAASEAFIDRGYDEIVSISRSGTTTEVLDLLSRVKGTTRTIGIVGDPASPMNELADEVIQLSFADEQSVVQTRFATAALAFLRASLGEDLSRAIADAEQATQSAITEELITAEQYTFLGRGWTVGLAHEAALKMREASQAWTESYPAMEYRHGPISIAAPGRVTWAFGSVPVGLADQVRATGAHFEHHAIDPLAELIRAQRVALERARRAGLDPDKPRNLSRAVILGN